MPADLLLISVDSLRLDHAYPIGSLVETPRFARAAAGFGFSEHCFSVASATRPAHASLFTGLYPFEHGVWGMHYPHMRPGTQDLFALLAAAGYRIEARSEVPSIFTGLDFARWMRPLGPTEKLALPSSQTPRATFLHFWSTHTPYGAADGKATGETLDLLRAGRVDIVQARYRRAVEILFERRLSPLLERIDRQRCAVFIFGDHGERWVPEEFYHGQTLHNDVLRVPLWYHIPHSGNPLLEGPISLLDLFPTALRLAGIDAGYNGYGVDLLGQPASFHLAQLEPIPDADEAVIGGHDLADRRQPSQRQWALFDGKLKYTYDGATDTQWMEGTLDGQRQEDSHLPAYRQRYAAALEQSAYGVAPPPQPNAPATDLLEERLRQLGYLD